MKELFIFLWHAINTPIRIWDGVILFSWYDLILKVLLPLTVSIFAYRLLSRLIAQGINKASWNDKFKKSFLKLSRLILRLSFIISLVFVFFHLFGAELVRIGDVFLRVLNQPFFTTGQTKINLITLLLLFPIFYLANWLAKITKNFFIAEVFPTFNLEEERISVLGLFIRYFVVAAVSLLGLSMIGLDLSSLTVIFGVLGLGVGFGLQGLVSNFFSGLSLIFARPIREGDHIFVGDSEGIVDHIKLLYTNVTTLTNESIIIPNSHIVNDVIHNYSYNDRSIILKIDFQVAYGSNLEQTIEVVEELMNNCPYKAYNETPKVYVKSLGSSGIDLEVWIKIGNIKNKVRTRSWTLLNIYDALNKNSISIPFPQMDVHFKEPT
ncbi:mechanosensitive ion channel family protein [Spirochaeta cellobiosiphila]|uniref:mechanosensitive ion channel family protein n=1 Tax=Spirochaeta cellobiosiphila TaxID=504483 RepID=UPI000423C0C1|nr:mechanosensitive ion channel domain-containing protein [Spirochaeta cellobiosiphila]